MKKFLGPGLLLGIFFLFAAFLTGLWLGRNVGREPLRVEMAETVQTESVPAPTRSALVDGKLDINAASAEEFAELPGIGPVLAERIVSYRGEIGSFTDVEQLKQVEGTGDKRLEELLNYITVR